MKNNFPEKRPNEMIKRSGFIDEMYNCCLGLDLILSFKKKVLKNLHDSAGTRGNFMSALPHKKEPQRSAS